MRALSLGPSVGLHYGATKRARGVPKLMAMMPTMPMAIMRAMATTMMAMAMTMAIVTMTTVMAMLTMMATAMTIAI